MTTILHLSEFLSLNPNSAMQFQTLWYVPGQLINTTLTKVIDRMIDI